MVSRIWTTWNFWIIIYQNKLMQMILVAYFNFFNQTHKRKYNGLIVPFPVFADDNKRAVLQRKVSHFAHMFIFCTQFMEIKRFDFLQKSFSLGWTLIGFGTQCNLSSCQDQGVVFRIDWKGSNSKEVFERISYAPWQCSSGISVIVIKV